MSDMFSAIAPEPAAGGRAEKTTAKSAPKPASDQRFEQLMTEQDVATDAGDAVEAEAQQADIDELIPVEAAELEEEVLALDLLAAPQPLPAFSPAHAALQLSLEPMHMADADGAAAIAVQEADGALVLAADAAQLEASDQNAAPDLDGAASIAAIAPAPRSALPAQAPAAAPELITMQDIAPIDGDIAAPLALDGSDSAEDSVIAQTAKIDVKAAAPQDTLSPQAAAPLQSDEPQGGTLLNLSQAKEPAAFEKLVAQAPQTAPMAEEKPATASPLVRNILDRMQELELSEGKTRILLRPQGMGALEIDLLRMADGRMHVAIRVENPMVLDALRNESNALNNFMGEKGFDLSQGGAELSSYRRPSQGDDEGAQEDGPASADDRETETALLDGERVNILT